MSNPPKRSNEYINHIENVKLDSKNLKNVPWHLKEYKDICVESLKNEFSTLEFVQKPAEIPKQNICLSLWSFFF
jgi:hypothetical protein